MSVHNICLTEGRGEAIVDLHLEVDENLTLQQAHDMASLIEQDVRNDMPDITRVNTHIESRGAGEGEGRDVTSEESGLVEAIRAATDGVAGRGSCHDISLSRKGSRFVVSLHCTFDRSLSIIQVHELTTCIEEQLKKDIPSLIRVLVHAEPDSS